MPHHHHVVFDSSDLGVVCILEPIDNLPIQGVSLDGFPLLQHYKHLVMRCPARECGPLHIPRLLILAYDHVPVCLGLKHCDLPPGVADYKGVSRNVEPHIHRLIWLIFVLQVDQKQQAVLFYSND